MQIDVPQTMMEFFQKSEGTWFSQRTVHNFDSVTPDQSGESNISIEVLAANHAQILAVCEHQGLDPAKAGGGGSFLWQDNQDKKEQDPDKAAIIVDIPDANGRSGKLLRNQGYVERIPVVSRYWFGKDGILTIDTDYDNNQGQERCWFINDDFRVRVSTVRSNNGVYIMTYSSERRCVSTAALEKMVLNNQARG